MKKIYAFILSGAAILAVTACNKETQVEDPAQNNGPVYETLSVKIGTETKVTLDTDAAKSAFEENDKIAVWTEAGAFQTCLVDAEGKITVDVSGGPRSCFAVYYNGATAPTYSPGPSNILNITLPDTYDYADVAGTKNPVPMVAQNGIGDASDMIFYAACALARITVSGIPATADKLLVTFDKDVTGEFTVDGPGTQYPSISAAALSTKNVVTINLTPGTDYSGAVINIPVPVGTITASVQAKAGDNVLETKTSVINSWSAARARGKKAEAAFTPSIYAMVLAPGNLYTESGTLKIASNYYDHVYSFSGNNSDYTDAGYQAINRTHFNFNEAYHLMHGTLPGDLTYTLASTDVAGDENVYSKSDIVGGDSKAWHIPSYADFNYLSGMEALQTTSTQLRPGAKVRNGESGEYTTGWMFVKVLVSGMGTSGTTQWDGATISGLAADATAPSTDYQAGLLLFPDNVEITGTFGVLGDKNANTSAFSTTTITKTNLDALIAAGCAFLPAAGRFTDAYGGWGSVGTGGSIFNCYRINRMDWAYFLNYDNSSFYFHDSSMKSFAFRHVRLVRYLN